MEEYLSLRMYKPHKKEQISEWIRWNGGQI
jgi:hypothetical protein